MKGDERKPATQCSAASAWIPSAGEKRTQLTQLRGMVMGHKGKLEYELNIR